MSRDHAYIVPIARYSSKNVSPRLMRFISRFMICSGDHTFKFTLLHFFECRAGFKRERYPFGDIVRDLHAISGDCVRNLPP